LGGVGGDGGGGEVFFQDPRPLGSPPGLQHESQQALYERLVREMAVLTKRQVRQVTTRGEAEQPVLDEGNVFR
jgi:hypothetical protein